MASHAKGIQVFTLPWSPDVLHIEYLFHYNCQFRSTIAAYLGRHHRDRTYLERECLVGLAWAVSEKIPARLYITIGLVAAY